MFGFFKKKNKEKNQCDLEEIFRNKRQDEKPAIKVSTAMFLLLQSAADADDFHGQKIQRGSELHELTKYERISYPLAASVFNANFA